MSSSQRVPGARVLDVYAGTGAIGIEALSRGAAHVTFVDNDARALKLIEQNLSHCGVSDRYAIIRCRLALDTLGTTIAAITGHRIVRSDCAGSAVRRTRSDGLDCLG